MKSLKDYYNEYICEGAKINGKMVHAGWTIICSNPYFADKPDWELKFIEKDGNNIRATNVHGVTVTVPISCIKEIIDGPKTKRESKPLSFEQAKKIRYQIADLQGEMEELLQDMENDPDVLAEQGAGGKATDRYGKEMNKIQTKIDALYDKLNA